MSWEESLLHIVVVLSTLLGALIIVSQGERK